MGKNSCDAHNPPLRPSPVNPPPPGLLQVLLGAALLLSPGTAAQAETFFLADEGGGKQFGSFDYQEGAPVVVADKTFVLLKVATMAGGMDLEKKLQSIILPTVELSNAKIELVVQFMQMRSAALDPEKKGVRLVLKLNGKSADPIPLISFTARQISMLEAIRTVAQMTGLTYRFDGNIVFIEPK